MKKQEGVTAVSLMVTIVIIMLIAGASLFTSQDLIVELNISTAYQDISTIKESVEGLRMLNELNPDEYVFEEIFLSEPISDISEYNERVGGKLQEGNEYFYLGFADDSLPDVYKESLKESMDLKSVNYNYIVNPENIEKVEVFLVDGVKVGDQFYYTYEEISAEYSNVNKK